MRDYEEGNMEDGDSGGDIHLDSGTDRYGNDIVHWAWTILKSKWWTSPHGGVHHLWL